MDFFFLKLKTVFLNIFVILVPSEIIARGPKAKRAYLNALKTGKVKVYRTRIMLIGQYRAGKTSLKKSLLGLPFISGEESTDGIDVVPCEVNTDQVKNWKRTDEKLGESQLASDLAKMVARDLQDTGDEGDERKNDKENEVEEKGEINPKQVNPSRQVKRVRVEGCPVLTNRVHWCYWLYGKVSIVTNGRIGANRKGCNSNGSIGEYASH